MALAPKSRTRLDDLLLTKADELHLVQAPDLQCMSRLTIWHTGVSLCLILPFA